MTVESAADRLAMLSDFGETFVLAGGVEITAIFNRDYVEVLGTESYRPMITVRSADVSSVKQGDQIVRDSDGTIYQAGNIQPDGTGMTDVMLEEQ